MLLTAIVVLLLALFIARILPAVLEYMTVRSDVNALAKSSDLKSASVAEVRSSFMKRAQVNNTDVISAADLDVSKEGGDLVIGFSYTKKIPLFGPVNLTIDFQGSSKGGS
jgi:hypothetical protein